MERKFEAPGPGTWALDTTHNSGAMTLYSTQTGLDCGEAFMRAWKSMESY